MEYLKQHMIESQEAKKPRSQERPENRRIKIIYQVSNMDVLNEKKV
jgi:hypothetical protein